MEVRGRKALPKYTVAFIEKKKSARECDEGELDLFTDENVVKIRIHLSPAGLPFSVMMRANRSTSVILYELGSIGKIARGKVHLNVGGSAGKGCRGRSLRSFSRPPTG